MTDINLSDFRRYFPISDSDIYLNHAAVSPFSTYVTAAIGKMINERSQGKIEVFEDLLNEKKQLKLNLARLITAEAGQIAIISNTSEGLNWLAQGLDWQPGEHVLLVENEFPANIYPFLNLRKRGVIIDYVPLRDGLINLQDIEDNICPQTKLLSISFVEFLSGFRNRLREIGGICRRHDVLFSVDGIQGVGAFPLDVQASGIDFLANGGHKWLMGPQGCGFMYLAPQLFKRLKPVFAGWLSVKDSWNFFEYNLDFLDDAGRFEIATHNAIGITGLRAATDLLLQAGVERISNHLLNLGEQLIEGLTGMKFRYIGSADKKERAGIYSFITTGEKGLIKYLQDKRVHLSLRNNVVRFSPHFYNTMEEIEQIIRLCREYYK
jgi:cysteine desulfurase/selenocysteine lyase